MGIISTWRPSFGPFRVNTGRRLRPTSVTMRLGPVSFRVWSPGVRRGISSIDLPGPFSFRPSGRRRG